MFESPNALVRGSVDRSLCARRRERHPQGLSTVVDQAQTAGGDIGAFQRCACRGDAIRVQEVVAVNEHHRIVVVGDPRQRLLANLGGRGPRFGDDEGRGRPMPSCATTAASVSPSS